MQHHVPSAPVLPATAPPPTEGVVVRYDAGLPGYERCALVLATIACPPRRPNDPRWQELVRAFCRIHMWEGQRIFPEFFAAPQTGTFNLGHLTFDLDRARRLVEEARTTLNARLVGSHVMMPFLWEGLGRAGKQEFRGYTPKATLNHRIKDVVDREEDRLDDLAARYGERPARRFAIGGDAFHYRNFLTKVLRPARPVLHLVAALDHVMHSVGAELRRSASPAMRDYLTIDVHGPHAHGWFLETMPELADAVVSRSWIYEQALPHLAVQKPAPGTVVRFRLDPVQAQVSR